MEIYYDKNTQEIMKQSYKYYKKYKRIYNQDIALSYALFYTIYKNDFDHLTKTLIKALKIKPTIKNRLFILRKESNRIQLSEESYKDLIDHTLETILTLEGIPEKFKKYTVHPIDLLYFFYNKTILNQNFFATSNFFSAKKQYQFETIMKNIIINSLQQKLGNEQETPSISTEINAKEIKSNEIKIIANTLSGEILTNRNFECNPLVGNEWILKKLEKKLITGNSIALVGETGAGKTTLVKGLAYAIKTNMVSDCLKNKTIVSVNTNALLSGTSYRGQLERKIAKLLDMAKQNKDVIFFFDEMHTLMSGKSNAGDPSFADILKSALSEKDIQIIGTTTTKEWDEILGQDIAFRNRFKMINIPFPEEEQLTDILLNYKNLLENRFQVKFDIDREFFKQIVKHTNKQNSTNYYETQKNPKLSLEIIESIFETTIYNNRQQVIKNDIIEGIMDNEILTENTKNQIIAFVQENENTESKSTSKVIKLKKNQLK